MSKNALFTLALLIPAAWCHGIVFDDSRIMGRGDVNNDQVVNMSDAIMLNNFLFNGGPEPPCLNQADANDDGKVNVSDSSYIMNWLFKGGPAPPAPGPYNHICTFDQPPYPGCAQPCG